jgi:5'-nucleotidase
MVKARGRAVALVVATLAALVMSTSPLAAAKQKVQPITVLVTNDDGVTAPGIDALAQALRSVPKTKVVVVAPATNQTGVGGKVTDGTVAGSAAMTASGYAATGVQGTPADSVNYALDGAKVQPTVTISGVNIGQNLGPIVDVSGTVGAARQSAKRGIPALAVSAQISEPDYALASKLAVDWLSKNRARLVKAAKAKNPAAPTSITSLNVPTCPSSKIRGLYETTLAPQGTADLVIATSNCASTATSYPNDAAAFNEGWATQTPVPVS